MSPSNLPKITGDNLPARCACWKMRPLHIASAVTKSSIANARAMFSLAHDACYVAPTQNRPTQRTEIPNNKNKSVQRWFAVTFDHNSSEIEKQFAVELGMAHRVSIYLSIYLLPMLLHTHRFEQRLSEHCFRPRNYKWTATVTNDGRTTET